VTDYNSQVGGMALLVILELKNTVRSTSAILLGPVATFPCTLTPPFRTVLDESCRELEEYCLLGYKSM
jgi:hypothetical protein